MVAKSKTETSGKKGRKAVDPNETAAQKFARLAKHRTLRAIKVIRGLGNLGGSQYASTPEQREKIRDTLEKELVASMARMERAKQDTGIEFNL